MKRLIFAALAFLVGCNGAGTAGNRFLPSEPGAAGPVGANAIADSHHRRIARVHITMTVPRRHVRGRGRFVEAHPATISPATQSVGIAVNGGTAQIFNVTPSSPSCSSGSGGTTCSFTVSAPVGTDTFAVTTYNATGGGGTQLDYGIATVPVVVGKANSASIRLGPVVSLATDSGVGSLRYAIGNANPGDTIMFVGLASGTTITLASPLSVTNSVTIAGPGVTAGAVRRSDALHAHGTYSGISVSGGGTQQIFMIQPGATVTIAGLILTQGKATISGQPGGAIFNEGVLTASADVFLSNTSGVKSPYVRRANAKSGPRALSRHPFNMHPHVCPPGNDTYGGALYNHGTANVTGSTFDSNSVAVECYGTYYSKGGAIYNDEYGILTSSGNTYVNNAAYYGGAVYNNAEYGSASFASDTFNGNLGCTSATGCADSGCSPPTSSCTTAPYGDGVGIYDNGGQGITVTSSLFENNVAGGASNGSYGQGAAIDLETGSPNVTGSTFTNNLAGGGSANCSDGYGGAVYVDTDGPAEFDNDTFTSNTAGGDDYGEGGAIYGDEPVQGTGDTFTSNTAVGSGSACEPDGGSEGGAVYGDDGAAFSSSTFTSNLATSSSSSQAGALFEDDPARLTGDTFTSNQAVATGATGTFPEAQGGAIVNDYILTSSGNTFSSNSATSGTTQSYEAYGGAVYNDYQMLSSGDSFTGNSVNIGGTGASEAYGGAVYSYGTPCCGASVIFTATGDTFKSNTATATGTAHSDVLGGAVYSEGQLSVNGGSFSSNSATGPYEVEGGAVYTDSFGSTITNATFSSNAAVGNVTTPFYVVGGAVDDEDGVTINGGSFSSNTALHAGGAWFEDDEGVANNATFSGNSTTGTVASTELSGCGGGGGIFINDSLVIANSTISGNTVASQGTESGGGGIYNNSGLTMTGSTVAGNSVTGASGASGGGILNNYTLAMTNSTLASNTSSGNGGGFSSLDVVGTFNVNLINDTLYQNAATGSGGNIYDDYLVTFGNTIVGGGTAATGPDIDNAMTLTSAKYNIVGTAVVGTFTPDITDQIGVNPQLLTLTNNGGPTFTVADTATSPGTGRIPFSGGLCNAQPNTGVDQRGWARGAGGRCDVGAYEFAGVAGSAPMLLHATHRLSPRKHRLMAGRKPDVRTTSKHARH